MVMIDIIKGKFKSTGRDFYFVKCPVTGTKIDVGYCSGLCFGRLIKYGKLICNWKKFMG
jgi:hypothetical protein